MIEVVIEDGHRVDMLTAMVFGGVMRHLIMSG